ncbi:carbon monoxide dehydrogenase subunit G-like protein [Halodesulfurarchaeum formicicum]|uniref:Carbon monoxide dehydrogenase subunit G-like protein n=1 Tax=Halodesulfurarchaeum formicicum TaxID=1873524 RepID=A0A1D8S5T9_9EURY|nr:SRPBCC domain-containing protein [Halodesulfurarchaeum formicicum]AOW80727.1 carbon monoxide dehydrogenase subunit G-like protein [Halodesulfurarchaeum formicicum]APE96064.1 carbon monoxide dehydrogenase subunit G-like protein [Halodesulfurarchaeum formicicum]
MTPDTDDDRSSLEFTDTVRADTDKQTLWEFISDAQNLADVVPGAKNVTRHTERRYALEIERGIGHVSVSLDGEFELVEMDEPDWIIAEGEAFDATTGSTFDVLAAMEMQETETGEVDLSYAAELFYTGGVASLGARLLKKFIEGDVDRYFENVKSRVEVD